MLEPKAVNYDNQVISIKLLNAQGDIIELIGKFLSQTDSELRIGNPQALVQVASAPNEPAQLGLVNFMQTGDNKVVTIFKSRVMAINLTHQGAAENYNQITSGVIAPATKIIT